ncbi:hypothetical protein AAL_07669 [Moelleriella libera RCEF 2490]|uniref:Uncharacterized protein n=1 Tax=Moelleriella libera RCEF 2490 TaxID=1081109 RepID=A0A166NDT9_9HYPO|nr:hypothetical protein AAL_07669 [Moelleriella libera RCEF 2490]
MKFSTVTSVLAMAVPLAMARPANKAEAPSQVVRTAPQAPETTSSELGTSDAEQLYDLSALVERGLEFFNDLLNDNPPEEKVRRRSVAVREAAMTLRDQLHSGDVDLNKAVDSGLKQFSTTATEIDYNDVTKQGFQLLRDGMAGQDFNKLAQSLFAQGSQKLTRREAWSWAGFINGPILRTAAKVGVSLASKAISSVDLNAMARSALSGLESTVGTVDMNQLASQGAGMLSSMLGGVNLNGVMKSVLGFLFPSQPAPQS